MLRLTAILLAFALAVGTGCSGSDDATGTDDQSTIQARELPAIWADILAERDRIQVATAKSYSMWHEDCEVVSKAANELDELASEMFQRVTVMPTLTDRRNGIQNLIGNFEAVVNSLRTSAIQETVGDFPKLMVTLDSYLSGIEGHFRPAEVGSDSIATHPGFNPNLLAPPASPI